jgi:hypothetical protein
MATKCCDPVYWKHDSGWDAYTRSSCYEVEGSWIPRWFDDFIVEDCATKKEAVKHVRSLHFLGVCIVEGS